PQADEFLKAGWPHPDAIDAIAFNGRGDRLVTACRDKTARVFAVGAGPDRPALLFPPVQHAPVTPSVPAFIDHDRGLVTITGASQLSYWFAESGVPRPPIKWSTKPTQLHCVVAGPRGDWFAVGGRDSAELWKAADVGKTSAVLEHLNDVRDLAFA